MEAEPEYTSVQAKDVLPTILCCLCGTRIQSNPSNMCVNCLRHQVDITAGISKQVTLFFCRGCGRYQRPPWVSCELESRELLALCLKKIKGLNKDVKLVDAGFIWTEPHSRRIKVKCTIQKEVHGGAIMQQTFVVEFVVTNQQCTDCQKSFTENTWNTVIQLRQKVKHKRTFFWLEQLLLKHNVVEKCFSVKEQPEGLDFYWNHKNQAMQMINFLNSVVPIRWQQAKRLVATDIQSNIETYKFTLNVEIVPICRDDLVLLPPKLASALGGSSPLLICVKVTSALHLLDPFSLKRTEVNADKYWRAPFQPLMNSRQLVEFVVLDVQKESPNHNNPNSGGKFALAEVTCAKTSDFGVNDKQYEVVSHLGHFLKPGDYVLGYDLGGANLSESASTALKNREMPEIVLIKKTYPEQKKNRNKNRRFKLRHLKKELPDHVPKKHEVKKMEEDYENFLNDIEEDPEMRKEINLYRREKMGANAGAASSSADDETKGDEDVPEVGLDELLEDLEHVGISHDDAEDSGMAPVESEADLNDLDESDLPPFVPTSKPN